MILTWIAIFRAIKSSHIPVSNVIGAAHRIVFSSRDTRTISCYPLRGATRHCAARFIIIEYYGVKVDVVRRVSLRECQGDQPNQGQYLHNYRVK